MENCNLPRLIGAIESFQKLTPDRFIDFRKLHWKELKEKISFF